MPIKIAAPVFPAIHTFDFDPQRNVAGPAGESGDSTDQLRKRRTAWYYGCPASEFADSIDVMQLPDFRRQILPCAAEDVFKNAAVFSDRIMAVSTQR